MYCIVAIFKNEAEILEEWINHYINEGCQQFFLIDNGSTDNYLPIINKYDKYIDLVIDDTKYKQSELYQIYFIHKVKKYTWTIICDLDEFVYARKGFKTITDYLNSIEDNVSQISIPWKIFGSNGFNTLDKKEPENVISNFTKRTNYDKLMEYQAGLHKIKYKVHEYIYSFKNPKYLISYPTKNNKGCFCKSIIRSNTLLQFNIHNHTYSKGYSIMSNNVPINKYAPYIPISEEILQSSYLHINHYIIRSLEWFSRIKMIRGAADLERNENIRNLDFYKKVDSTSNDIDDLELLHKQNIY
jgi:hypothetical protein